MTPSSFRGLFPRVPASAQRARRIVKDVARYWLAGDDLGDFIIAAGEAFAHALQEFDGRSLAVSCRFDAGRLVLDIEDSGLVSPHDGEALGSDEHQDALAGYRISIMRAIADGVELLDDGRRLRLTKTIAGDQPSWHPGEDVG